jgi:hypothetical protein
MAQDILIDETGDLVIENGDFKVGNSDMQHMTLLVSTFLGAWKQYPLRGVGALNFSASSGKSKVLARTIKDQATSDGFINVQVGLSANSDDNFNYNITAERTD